nr:EOG090X09QT [Sida crystallina]
MAKWGEGDPRWIVEERPDAVNVNNWHWTEKNASQWSKDKLTELLEGYVIKDKAGTCIIKEIEKMEGEASANNRKAKLIFFYEWALTLKWQGTVPGTSKLIDGSIVIPNLSDEHSPEEVDLDVNLVTTGPEADALKLMLRTVGTKLIREQLAKYIKSLKEDFTHGMILPKKEDDKKSEEAAKPASKGPGVKLPVSNSSPDIQKLNIGTKIETAKFECYETFKCPPIEIYNVLTQPELLRVFTNAEARVEAAVGGKFSLLGGHISGCFSELVPNKKIVQKWRYRTWPEAHHSTVTIQLEDKGDSTELRLTQTGIPASELETTKEGWQRHFWEAIKRTFGFGAYLF